MTEPALITRGLELGYRGPSVVRSLDMSLQAGQMTALLGPNGAGKTTTLLGLAGVLTPRRGSVRILGSDIGATKPHRVARMGFRLVPDSRGIFGRLTVRENLDVAGLGHDGRELVYEYFPQLHDRLTTPAGALSGGEQQMLALGMAIASKPQILAVDEMSLGLAPLVVTYMLDTLRRFCDEHLAAVLIVEQFIDAALSVTDRALVMQRGELVLDEASDELAKDRDRLEHAYLGLDGSERPAEGSESE